MKTILVTSIFSFSHNVFYPINKNLHHPSCNKVLSANTFEFDKDEILSDSKGLIIVLTLSQTSPGFTCLQSKSFENTAGKGEIARNEQFLLFPQSFLPV